MLNRKKIVHVSKHVILEENMEGVQSSMDVASVLCGMSQGQLLNFMNHCRPDVAAISPKGT